jgi:hypothetical protein
MMVGALRKPAREHGDLKFLTDKPNGNGQRLFFSTLRSVSSALQQ